jgi:DNA-binding transcriptional regulator YbjK
MVGAVRGRPPRQDRSVRTRERLAEAAVRVLGEKGLAGLTHRAVAAAAGTSLATATYYFPARDDLIAEASRATLAAYTAAFRRVAERGSEGGPGIPSLRALIIRLVAKAAGSHRIATLAWCEIILDAGRRDETRRLARAWFQQAEAAWTEIAAGLAYAEPRDAARSGIEAVIGLIFITRACGVDADGARAVLEEGRDPLQAWRPAEAQPDDTRPSPKGPKAEATRERIVLAAIDLLITRGAGAVGHRTVAERAGLTTSAPAYHFRSIDDLLACAQQRLFEAAKTRYRQGMGGGRMAEATLADIADLTSVIFLREATEHAAANIAGFSLWLDAARHPGLRPTVWAAVEDQSRAWGRLLAFEGREEGALAGLMLQSLFLGKLVRAIATGADTADLAAVRGQFERSLLEAQGQPLSESRTVFQK